MPLWLVHLLDGLTPARAVGGAFALLLAALRAYGAWLESANKRRLERAFDASRGHVSTDDRPTREHLATRDLAALRETLASARVQIARLEGELDEVRADLYRTGRDHAQTAAALVTERAQSDLLTARVRELEEALGSALSGYVRPVSDEPPEMHRSQRPTPRSGTWGAVTAPPPGGHPHELDESDPTPTRDRRIPRWL